MFISDAFAAEGQAAGGDMSMMIVLVVCMLAVYFFVMRPNSKKRKEMQKLLDNLAVGDEVLTNGGIAGKIVKLPDNKEYVLVAISEGMVMQIKRNYVVAVLPKGTLVAVDAPAPKASASSRRPARKPRSAARRGAKAAESAETAEVKEIAEAADKSTDTPALETKADAAEPAAAPAEAAEPAASKTEEAK